MNKWKCIKCGKIPAEAWLYMPSTGDGIDYFYCDDCVPRGCTCNSDLKEGIDYESPEAENPDNWVVAKDEKGREYPCCEYWWIDNEHTEQQRLELERDY